MPSSAPQERSPFEPHEPWLVGTRHQRPDRQRRRRWLLPVVAGALASSAAALVLTLGGHSHTTAARPTARDMTTGAINPPQPRPSTGPTRAVPHPSRHQPPDQEARRHRRVNVSPHPFMAPPPAPARRNGPTVRRDIGKPRHVAHSRPWHRKSAHSHRTPAWVGPECRRRFPHDRTRQAACITALHNYFSR